MGIPTYKIRIFLIAVGIIAIGFGIISSRGTEDMIANSYEGQGNSEGGVEIAVLPITMGPKASQWKFKVTLSTHYVELDYNMIDATIMTNEFGDTYNPVAWEGDPPGGHHISGILTFAALKQTPKSITLTMRTIAGVPERVFRWTLGD